MCSPNQVLTHAARAAAKQLNGGAFSGTSGGRAWRARRALVRVTTCVSEAFCPNFQLRARASYWFDNTGLIVG